MSHSSSNQTDKEFKTQNFTLIKSNDYRSLYQVWQLEKEKHTQNIIITFGSKITTFLYQQNNRKKNFLHIMVADCSRKTLDIFQKYRKIKFEMKKREISKHKNIQKWIELKIHVPSKFLSLFVFYGFCFIFFMISLFFFCSAVYCSMGSAELVKKTNFPGKIFFFFFFYISCFKFNSRTDAYSHVGRWVFRSAELVVL